MFLTRIQSACAVLLVTVLATLGTSTLISRAQTAEPDSAPAARSDVPGRVAELKREFQALQAKLDRLEQETAARHGRGNPGAAFLAERFKYRIRFETGWTETREGGRIDLQEVWGTRPRIEVGGQYLVSGKYVLPPGQHGKLYFYETSEGAGGVGPDMDLQSVTLDRERGEFTLMHAMQSPGYFHLILADPERYSQWFANVYFGTGDNVLRKKP